MVVCDQVGRQRVAGFLLGGEHLDPAARSLARQQEQDAVLVDGHSAEQIQFKVVSKEHLQMGEHKEFGLAQL